MEKKKINNKIGKVLALVYLGLFLELVLVVILFSHLSVNVIGDIGQNVTVITELDVGNVFPEILNVTLEDYATSFDLTQNNSKIISCIVLMRDYNGDTDINKTNAEFYDTTASSYGAVNDSNNHYTNVSCDIDYTYGDSYEARANCTFSVQYYANPDTWSCMAFINDSFGLNDTDSDNITMNKLLSVSLPATINYGTVNATDVSLENVTDVINYGNTRLNLSLSGYAISAGDNLSMNCSLGTLRNISIDYEKFNLSASVPIFINLTDFELNYTNLTSDPTARWFDMNYRQNDTENEAINQTYWRIYVPLGVAGTCSGNLEVSATEAPAA